jgi:hypothetical protein
VSHPGCTLPAGLGPLVPIQYKAGWAPEPVWMQRLEEKSFSPSRDRTLVVQSVSDVIMTELPQLITVKVIMLNEEYFSVVTIVLFNYFLYNKHFLQSHKYMSDNVG